MSAWTVEIATLPPVSISVNVSTRQLADAWFVPDVEAAFQQTGIDPSRLHLEMTESAAAADPKLTATVLSHLKHLRVGVILDDFGTGNSSLSGLRRFPIDALKIDCSLINEMLTDRATCDTVDLIILLTHELKLKVIAEGIETTRQLDHLHALGCDLGLRILILTAGRGQGFRKLLRQQNPLPHAKAAGMR